MSTWTPDVALTVDGVALPADQVLDVVTIRRGRDGVDEQPRAGYTTLALVDHGAQLERIRTDARLTVTVDGHALVTDADVSDVVVQLEAAGQVGQVAVQTVTALGRLARLHRRGRQQPLPSQRDGDRVAAVLEQLVTLPWFGASTWPPVAGSWADAPAGMSWLEIDPTPLEVDTPGRYQLAALTNPTDPLEVLHRAASDGLGQLAELRNGGIRYTDAGGRQRQLDTDGWLELPPAAVGAVGLTVTASVADVATRVTVSYIDQGGTGERVDASVEDQALSDARGGVLEQTVETRLTSEADALDRAALVLDRRSSAAASIEELTVLLDKVDPTVRQQLLQLEVGTPVRVPDLPAALGGPTFEGVVEAVTWTVRRATVRAQLRVSAWIHSADPNT